MMSGEQIRMDKQTKEILDAFGEKLKAIKDSTPKLPIVEGEEQIKRMLKTIDPVIKHAAKIYAAVMLDPNTRSMLLTERGYFRHIDRACTIAWQVHRGMDPETDDPIPQECVEWFAAHHYSVESVAISIHRHANKLARASEGWFGRINKAKKAQFDNFWTDVFGDFDLYKKEAR